MPLTPKNILGTAIDQGRKVVGAGAGLGKRFRRGEDDAGVTAGKASSASAKPSTTAKPASAKPATAAKPAKPAPKASAAKTAPRTEAATTERSPASNAAAAGGGDVTEAKKP